MKVRIKVMLILGLLMSLISLAGCQNNDEKNAKNIAKKFTEQFYNLDVKSAKKSLDPNVNIVSEHDKFKEYMTEDGYNTVLANRMYIRNLNASVNNDCSFKIKDIKFETRFYDKEENKIGFDYVANIETTYEKDKKKVSGEEKGYIGLVKDNNQWKIYVAEITKYGEMFNDKNRK